MSAVSTTDADAATHAALDRLRRDAPSRSRLGGLTAATAALVVASFASLDLPWAAFASRDALASMGRFLGEFTTPDVSPRFVARVAVAAWETFAMSAVGTGLAAGIGAVIAVYASRSVEASGAGPRLGAKPLRSIFCEKPPRVPLDAQPPRVPFGLSLSKPRFRSARTTVLAGLSNLLRAIPELVWASLLLIAAGLGPFAGTLALALHTSGVLGRLYTEAIENAPPGPGAALRAHGVGRIRVFLYATLPQILPQLVSYTLYRWENNIRAAAVLGVVGAGGLGQQLAFHLGLFQMSKTATVIAAMLVLVAVVDGASHLARRVATR